MLSSSCWHTQKQSRALLFGDSNRLPVWCFGLGLEAVFCSTYVHYLKMGWTAQGCSRYTGACPYLSCVLDGSGASKNIESIWKQHWPSSFAFTDAKHSSMCQWVRSSHMFCKLSRAFFCWCFMLSTDANDSDDCSKFVGTPFAPTILHPGALLAWEATSLHSRADSIATLE